MERVPGQALLVPYGLSALGCDVPLGPILYCLFGSIMSASNVFRVTGTISTLP